MCGVLRNTVSCRDHYASLRTTDAHSVCEITSTPNIGVLLKVPGGSSRISAVTAKQLAAATERGEFPGHQNLVVTTVLPEVSDHRFLIGGHLRKFSVVTENG